MLEKKNDALIAAKAVLARYGGYLQDDPAPLGPRPRSQLSQAAPDQWKAILAALGAARPGIRGPDAFNPHTRRRNNHATDGRRSYACCELKTLRAQRTYPFQEADPADREQHRAICGRPPRALRFGPMIFGPKGFAPGPVEGDTR